VSLMMVEALAAVMTELRLVTLTTVKELVEQI